MLYLLGLSHLDLNIQPVPGEDAGAVLGYQQHYVHLADHLQDDNNQADFLDVYLFCCLGFRYVYCDQEKDFFKCMCPKYKKKY